MPVVFLFSAMVSGIAAVLLIYTVVAKWRGEQPDMNCLDTVAKYLFYAFVVDFSLEMLDVLHRIYESEESFRSLDFMVHTRLFFSQIVLQILIGTLIPLFLLGLNQVVRLRVTVRLRMYVIASLLTLIGIFSMRWNVVIGGQLFSKSFLGYTSYKLDFITREGILVAAGLTILPLIILVFLLKLLPPWREESPNVTAKA